MPRGNPSISILKVINYVKQIIDRCIEDNLVIDVPHMNSFASTKNYRERVVVMGTVSILQFYEVLRNIIRRINRICCNSMVHCDGCCAMINSFSFGRNPMRFPYSWADSYHFSL